MKEEKPKKNSGIIKACKVLKEIHPNKHSDFYLMKISVEVLRQLIDTDWVDQTFFKIVKTQKKNEDAFSFFKSQEIGYMWQSRISNFSENVFNIRKIKNFDLIVKEIKSGNLVSRYAEIEVGAHLLRRGIKFEFVKPSGKKKLDFDIKIIDDLIVNCEIKHKIESTSLSNNTIKNTLSSANKQLPQNEPGIIFIQIPQSWADDTNTMQILNRIISPFFERNKSHIIGIVLRWEGQDKIFKNVFYSMYKLLENDFYETDRLIDKFLDKLKADSINNEWVFYDDLVKKYII